MLMVSLIFTHQPSNPVLSRLIILFSCSFSDLFHFFFFFFLTTQVSQKHFPFKAAK